MVLVYCTPSPFSYVCFFFFVCGLTSQSSETERHSFYFKYSEQMRIMTLTDNESCQAIPKTDCFDL